VLLQRKDLNPNTPDAKYGRTPLWSAAGGGYERIVQLLLERDDIDPNIPDTTYNQTPLLLAAVIGHEGVVKLVLERKDINPSTPGLKYGYTPLLLATVGGHEGVVKLLSGREGLNPDIPGLSGETALELTVFWGHVRVLQLLSESNPPLHNLQSHPAITNAKYQAIFIRNSGLSSIAIHWKS